MRNKRSPWAWIPTLYFAEGIPYVAVMTISVIMYKRLGLSNTEIAFYTGWLGLPWVLKPFWSPFVDLIKSKRWWTLTMQWLLAFSLGAIAFSIPTPFCIQATMAVFMLIGFASATHDIAADGYYMIALTEHQQSFYVGIRSTFYRLAVVVGQGALVVLAGYIEMAYGNIPMAWTVVFIVLSVFFFVIVIYHNWALPKIETDRPAIKVTARDTLKGFLEAFRSFFTKFPVRQTVAALLFMLLYRFPEAQLTKIIQPFLLDSIDQGGLGMTTGEVGIAYGTVGIIGLTIGGIIGGIVAAKWGLKKSLMPMAWSMSLTCLTFVYLSYTQEQSLFIINLCVVIEQFGYGFGFTAYMLYLIYYSEGEFKTSHYAICTGFMALSMMTGMIAGWIQEAIGYKHFFLWAILCCLTTIGVSLIIKVDPEFGRKVSQKVESASSKRIARGIFKG